MHKAPGTSSGFALLEILVALVITIAALSVLFGGVGSSLRTASRTATWTRVILWAQAHLATIDDPASVLGERRGQDQNGFRWQTSVAFLGAVRSPNPGRNGIWARGTGLYAVTVTIFWRDQGAEQRFDLRTAELGPLPGAAP